MPALKKLQKKLFTRNVAGAPTTYRRGKFMKTIVVAIAFILAFLLTIAVLTSLIAITGLGAGIVEMAIIVIIAAIVGYFVACAVNRKQKP